MGVRSALASMGFVALLFGRKVPVTTSPGRTRVSWGARERNGGGVIPKAGASPCPPAITLSAPRVWPLASVGLRVRLFRRPLALPLLGAGALVRLCSSQA